MGNNTSSVPFIINLQQVGSSEIGYINIANNSDLDFDIRRAYWVYSTPEKFTRGNHAHKSLKQVLVALNGTLHIELEDKSGIKRDFTIDKPSQALFVPSGYWRTINFSKDSILLCLASEEYDENDYIRDYKKFKTHV